MSVTGLVGLYKCQQSIGLRIQACQEVATQLKTYPSWQIATQSAWLSQADDTQ